MDKNPAPYFDRTIGVKVEEMFGNCLVQIEPGSYCVFDESKPTNSMHYHNCYEICFVTDGTGEFIHDGMRYTLGKGDVFVANPGKIHEIRLLKDAHDRYTDRLYLVFFRFSIYSGAHYTGVHETPGTYEGKMFDKFLDGHVIISRQQYQLFPYLSFIESYTSTLGSGKNDYGIYQAVRNMALESIFSLVSTHERGYGRQTPAETAVDLAISYIGANLNRPLYVRDVASSAHTSERNLQYLFKKHMKMSVIDYINRRKMAVAAGYLKMNFKVRDVCGLVGIDEPSHFTRLFKKYYGLSPKHYQLGYSPEGMVSGVSYANN